MTTFRLSEANARLTALTGLALLLIGALALGAILAASLSGHAGTYLLLFGRQA